MSRHQEFYFRGNQNKIKYTFRMQDKCNRLFETNNSRIKTRIRMTTGYPFGGGRVCFLRGVMISGRLASGDQKLTLEVVPLPPPLRGGTPLYKPCIYPPSSTGLVFGPVWSEKGYRLYSWTYLSFQFQMNKKEEEMLEFEWILRNLFSWRSNLSNDDIIS